MIKKKRHPWQEGECLRQRSALCVHTVHGDRSLQVVRVRVQRVVVCVRVPVGVKLVAEQRGRLGRRVQVEVVIVVADVDAGRERVVVPGRILAVLLRTHGAVAWRQNKHMQRFVSLHSLLLLQLNS